MRQTYDYPSAPKAPSEGVNYGNYGEAMNARLSVQTLLAVMVLTHMAAFRFPSATNSGPPYGNNVSETADFDQSVNNYENMFRTTAAAQAPEEPMFKDVFTGMEDSATTADYSGSASTDNASTLWDMMAQSRSKFANLHANYRSHYGMASQALYDSTAQFTPSSRSNTFEETPEAAAARQARQEKRRQADVASQAIDKVVNDNKGLNWMKGHYDDGQELVADIERMRTGDEPLTDAQIYLQFAAEANSKGMQGNDSLEDPRATTRFQMIDALMGGRKGALPF